MTRRKKRKQKPSPDANVIKAPPNSFFHVNGRRFTRIETYPPGVVIGKPNRVVPAPAVQLPPASISVTTIHKHKQDGILELPSIARIVLTTLLRLDERVSAIGDVVEKYDRKHRQFGKEHADRWLRREVVHSILPLLIRLVKTVIWLILGEWIKKHIS